MFLEIVHFTPRVSQTRRFIIGSGWTCYYENTGSFTPVVVIYSQLWGGLFAHLSLSGTISKIYTVVVNFFYRVWLILILGRILTPKAGSRWCSVSVFLLILARSPVFRGIALGYSITNLFNYVQSTFWDLICISLWNCYLIHNLWSR